MSKQKSSSDVIENCLSNAWIKATNFQTNVAYNHLTKEDSRNRPFI